MGCSHDACFTTCYGWYIDERGWFISYIFRVHYHHHELAITTVIKWEFIIWITTPGLRSSIQLKLYRYSQLFTTSLHHKMQSNGPSAIAWPWDIWKGFVCPKTCMSQIQLLSLLCWTKFWAIPQYKCILWCQISHICVKTTKWYTDISHRNNYYISIKQWVVWYKRRADTCRFTYKSIFLSPHHCLYSVIILYVRCWCGRYGFPQIKLT